MKNQIEKIKYFAYVRKSTEGEERQALSIESQKDKVKEIHPDLDIIDILEEKHSAFKPYNRPVFDDMIKRIESGEARGIIAWHPDRLSRNEIDASTITYLVRTNVIHDLKFGSYNFDNSPEGIMMLQLALSQSQYFSSKLGKDVKRGLEKKVSMGWLPGVAPEGYINNMQLDKGQKTISVDKKRSILLRKAFDLILSGSYTPPEALNILNKEWHYTTVKRRKVGGNELGRSTWYKMLSNPFYAGIIVFNGKEYKGKHKPLITLTEYNLIQELLGSRGCKRKPEKHDFAYAGMFKCGQCGCSITAENKSKYLQKSKKVKEYTYYHCTHKKDNCRQGVVEQIDITNKTIKTLNSIEIHPLLLTWALEYLDSQKGKENKEAKQVENNALDKIKRLETELSSLTRMRAKELIGDDEYIKERLTLTREIEAIKQQGNNKPSHEEMIKITKDNFIETTLAKQKFITGSFRDKKDVLSFIGSNRQIINKTVVIKLKKWLIPIAKFMSQYGAEIARFEPNIIGLDYRKNEALTSLRLTWLRGSGSNRRPTD